MKAGLSRLSRTWLALLLCISLGAACKSGANNANAGVTTTSTTTSTTNKGTTPAGSTATPASRPTPEATPASEARTPPEGSVERIAIFDAIREQQKRKTSLTIARFDVESLKVHNGWAYIVTDTESADGEPYGMLEALLQEQGGRWEVVEELDKDDRAALKARHKDAPDDIFPKE